MFNEGDKNKKLLVYMLLCIWVCLLQASPASLTAQALTSHQHAAISKEDVNKIEAIISAEMARQNIPGLSVAIVVRDQLVWSSGFGLADMENFVPSKVNTVYRLASLSKPITAVAVMQLVEQGKLDLDAPVQRYCPAFPKKHWMITTRQLLGHLAGIRHYREHGGDDWSNPEINSTLHYESLTRSLDIFKDDPLLFEPGTRWNYSTYGYTLLGCIVEAASGMKFADYLSQNVFRPAGMMHTRVDDVRVLISNRARGYAQTRTDELQNAPLSDTSNKIPGGGLCSTVDDIGRFVVALNSNRLLKSETRQTMFAMQKTVDGKETGYGLGWFIMARSGEKVVRHGGSSQGLSAGLFVVPSRGYALVVLANKQDVNTFQLDQQITKLLLR